MPPVLFGKEQTPQPLDNRQHSSSAPGRSPQQQEELNLFLNKENEYGSMPPSTVSPRLYGKPMRNENNSKRKGRRRRRQGGNTGNDVDGGRGRGRGRGRKKKGMKTKRRQPRPSPVRYEPSPSQNYMFGMSPRRPAWNGSTAMGLGGRDPSLHELLPDVPHEWLESILSPRAVSDLHDLHNIGIDLNEGSHKKKKTKKKKKKKK